MITATSKINTIPEAREAMVSTLKNPPKTPIEAFKWVASYVNVSSVFGKTIGGLIPGVGSVIGSLTDIFSAFSSAPSLGEIVLDGLKSLSFQINDIKNELTATIEKTAEIQTARTVDYVLQGVDEIQREVSALQVMQSISEESALKEIAAEKAQIYTEYLYELNQMQLKSYADMKIIIDNCEVELQNLYKSLVVRFGNLGIDFFKYLESLTAQQPQTVAVSRSVPGEALTPAQAQDDKKAGGFNPLLLSPLLLLFFMKRKK